ncbi:HNH endonuclease family protein [Pseudonocardia xinjiangensis]|uniref:HNH endonuclease family protein n=1 Tax=Pseudonocardia xinjiangensis TaxID=75289 RepID=UPI003D8D547D
MAVGSPRAGNRDGSYWGVLGKIVRILVALLAALLLVIGAGGCTAIASLPEADPGSGASGAGDAHSKLDALVERAPASMRGYSRDRFPHWSTQGKGGCDTRDLVLQRDGTDVVVKPPCKIVSGVWHSPYDGATWTDPADVDIDHVVPLAEAWRSGAADWDDDRREAFANDLDGPGLLTVTDNVNQAKGDQPPNLWKPKLTEYWCTYATLWIDTKSKWDLSVTSAERSTLLDMLNRC